MESSLPFRLLNTARAIVYRLKLNGNTRSSWCDYCIYKQPRYAIIRFRLDRRQRFEHAGSKEPEPNALGYLRCSWKRQGMDLGTACGKRSRRPLLRYCGTSRPDRTTPLPTPRCILPGASHPRRRLSEYPKRDPSRLPRWSPRVDKGVDLGFRLVRTTPFEDWSLGAVSSTFPVCDGGCASDDDCDVDGGSWCQVATQTCVQGERNGGACSRDSECGSGECVDGVCCTSACDAGCFSCNQGLTGQPAGVCAPVLEGVVVATIVSPGSRLSAGSMALVTVQALAGFIKKQLFVWAQPVHSATRSVTGSVMVRGCVRSRYPILSVHLTRAMGARQSAEPYAVRTRIARLCVTIWSTRILMS